MQVNYVSRNDPDIVSVFIAGDGWHSVSDRSLSYVYRWPWSRKAIRFFFEENGRYMTGPASSIAVAVWSPHDCPDCTPKGLWARIGVGQWFK